MPHRTTEQWAGLLSGIISLSYFIQGALEENCSEGHRSSAIYFAMGVNVLLLTVAMWYGFIKEKSFLLKLYIITMFMMGLGCLFAPALREPTEYGDHCYLAKVEPVVIGVLQLLTVGVVWRGLYMMSHPSVPAVSPAAEAPPPPSEPQAPESAKNDDPPSYNDVVLFRSFSSPPEKSTAFTVPMPNDSSQGLQFSYGSLDSMPPSYYLAVSQAPYDPTSAAPRLSSSGSGSSDSDSHNAMSVLDISEYWNTQEVNN